MALEESPERFFERFAEAGFEAELLPVPMGYPLLEIALEQGLLHAFDRGAPPVPHGRVTLILHGVVRRHRPEEGPPELRRLRGGGHRFRGRVIRDWGDGFYLLESVVPVLIHAPRPLATGKGYAVELAPPLMGFRP